MLKFTTVRSHFVTSHKTSLPWTLDYHCWLLSDFVIHPTLCSNNSCKTLLAYCFFATFFKVTVHMHIPKNFEDRVWICYSHWLPKTESDNAVKGWDFLIYILMKPGSIQASFARKLQMRGNLLAQLEEKSVNINASMRQNGQHKVRNNMNSNEKRLPPELWDILIATLI